MLAHIAKLAVERKCCRIEWDVKESNKRAIRFFESTGASLLASRKVYTPAGDALRKLAYE